MTSREYSWLKAEKDFISQAIENGKSILGVCLGSQLIADVLGSRIYKNPRARDRLVSHRAF